MPSVNGTIDRLAAFDRVEPCDRKTVVFVTHYTPEAVFLPDRSVVMSSRLCRFAAGLRIDLPRPQTVEHRLGQLALQIFRALTGTTVGAAGTA